MATATFIPLSEYLATTYRPDCDYIDGEVKERNLGERPHSLLQLILGSMFLANLEIWDALPMPEQRVQISPTRYRIPDICVVRRSDPADAIVRHAPLLCVEILSREDRLPELQERVDDYASMGVAQSWVIDPICRIGYMAGAAGFLKPEDGVLTVPGTPIRIELKELFAKVDALQSGA
jgi:Uma2 family endonuclease